MGAILPRERQPTKGDAMDELVTIPLSFAGKSIPITAPKDDFITKTLVSTKTFYEADLLKDLLKGAPTGVYVDVGAHIGNHTLAFAAAFPATKVIAIEPSRTSFHTLCVNAQSFERDRIECHGVAIHDELRTVFIEAHNTINTGNRRIHVNPGPGMETTPARRLDEIIGDASVALIKMDVEGSEPAVIRSAFDTIRRSHPIIVAEAKTRDLLALVWGLLRPFGYTPSKRYCATPTYIFRSKLCA